MFLIVYSGSKPELYDSHNPPFALTRVVREARLVSFSKDLEEMIVNSPGGQGNSDSKYSTSVFNKQQFGQRGWGCVSRRGFL